MSFSRELVEDIDLVKDIMGLKADPNQDQADLKQMVSTLSDKKFAEKFKKHKKEISHIVSIEEKLYEAAWDPSISGPFLEEAKNKGLFESLQVRYLFDEKKENKLLTDLIESAFKARKLLALPDKDRLPGAAKNYLDILKQITENLGVNITTEQLANFINGSMNIQTVNPVDWQKNILNWLQCTMMIDSVKTRIPSSISPIINSIIIMEHMLDDFTKTRHLDGSEEFTPARSEMLKIIGNGNAEALSRMRQNLDKLKDVLPKDETRNLGRLSPSIDQACRELKSPQLDTERKQDETGKKLTEKIQKIKSDVQSYLERKSQPEKISSALKACEQAKLELLAVVKENMGENDKVNYAIYFPHTPPETHRIELLLQENKATDKSYLDALNAYKAINDLSNILKNQEKQPEDILSLFNKGLSEKSQLIEKYRDSNTLKVAKVILAFVFALSVIGIPAAYLLSKKTKGEKIAAELNKEVEERKPTFKR